MLTQPHPGTQNTIRSSSLLAELGLYGLDAVEPLILAGLVSKEPMLLIGDHGTGKSLLFVRLAGALGLAFRHFNASLLNYDDLVGYPLPDGNGGLEYVLTPATVWGAEAVFIDEISRCRPDMQNKLFPVIHEKRVQGIDLKDLVYRWSAMNPPVDDDSDELTYLGSEPLDPALADRFALIISMPDWRTFSVEDQHSVILAGEFSPNDSVTARIRSLILAAQDLMPEIFSLHGKTLASYVQILVGLLERSNITCSARRAGMILRNILAVHAVRYAQNPNVEMKDSAFLAINASLPQPACGAVLKSLVVHSAHKEAWRTAGADGSDALRLLLAERDPIRRALRAVQMDELSRSDRSGVVADALAALPPGARHALASEILMSNEAGTLVAAVAEQCADLYAAVATAQSVHETVSARSGRHVLWQRTVDVLAQLDPSQGDNRLLSNLITGMFASDDIATAADLDQVVSSWQSARAGLARIV